MPAVEKRLLRSIANYSRFNAQRTLAVESDSEFTIKQFGEASALADPARPRLPLYNRVLGLGLDDASQVREILAHFKKLGCEPHFDLGTEAIVPELISDLVGRGFEPRDALTYMKASPGSQPFKPSPGVHVERWGSERADDFRALLANSGVTCSDEIWDRRRDLYATDSFRVFVASIDGLDTAWATSFVDDPSNSCYFANAYTQPDHRSCGCHRALLDARLADAHQLGYKTAFTDIMPDTLSERNCKRAGFDLAFTLTLWHR